MKSSIQLKKEALRSALALKGFSQSDLADKIGMQASSVSKMFSRGFTKASTAKKICEVLNAEFEALFVRVKVFPEKVRMEV